MQRFCAWNQAQKSLIALLVLTLTNKVLACGIRKRRGENTKACRKKKSLLPLSLSWSYLLKSSIIISTSDSNGKKPLIWSTRQKSRPNCLNQHKMIEKQSQNKIYTNAKQLSNYFQHAILQIKLVS